MEYLQPFIKIASTIIKNTVVSGLLFTLLLNVRAQEITVHPPNWYIGLQNNQLQLLIHKKNLADYTVDTFSEGWEVTGIEKVQNPNYLFINISIGAGTQSSQQSIHFTSDQGDWTLFYELKNRADKTSKNYLGPEDLLYLIMPDRFANGDTSNDVIPGMLEQGIDRDYMFARHGGDLKGVADHIDYLTNLGVTAIWLNPVLENDQPTTSYHGYAQTDLYRVDPRLGSNSDYNKLIVFCHDQGVKVVQDMVYNHWGSENFIIKDLPDSSWVHMHKDFTKSNFRASVLSDPNASEEDKRIFNEGWFDLHMPDLHQNQHLLSQYLIQNSLWWIEFANLDGFRIDTYAYSDQEFMQELNRAVLSDFPGFTIFGETWVQAPGVQSWFTTKNGMKNAESCNLPGVTDFQLYFALKSAMQEPFGWTEGVSRLYYSLCQDGLYQNPLNNVVFLDNHDLSRFYAEIGGDRDLLQCGLAFLMTIRGTPMLYYGTELGFNHYADPDGKVREDVPGGWLEDSLNFFDASQRTGEVREIFDYTKRLATWRKSNPWLGGSHFMHFIPIDGVYVYFRFDEQHLIMVVLNPENKNKTVALSRFNERINNRKLAFDIVSQSAYSLDKTLTIGGKSVLVLDFNQKP